MSILPHGNRSRQWMLSWDILTILEPRLRDVEQTLIDAMSLPPSEYQTVFRLVRLRVAELVGWSAGSRHPVLGTSDAYHAVLAHLIAIAQRREDLR